jgi:STE24 endopeptidase
MKVNPQVEAATAAYIDSLGPAALHKAQDYTIGGHWLLLWGLVVGAVVTWLIVRSRMLDRLDRRISERRQNLRVFALSAVFLLVSAILSVPWTFYSNWWREKSYGRTSQPFGDFLGQTALATLITSLIAALFMIGVYWLIRRTGRRWWIWSGGLTAAALAFIMLLSPILIEPLFNKYEPVPAGQVRNALVTMAGRAGIPPNKIYMYNGSRQSNNFTANVSGVGSSARVAISDVAFKNASLDEVRAVTGHEIGHYVLKHVWYGVALYAAVAILLFWLADRLYPRFARLFGTDAPIADPRGVPVLLFMVTLFALLVSPLLNSFSRVVETQADLYSLKTENRPDALATALVKTAEYRYPRPGTLEEIIFYDHPSVESRVRMGMEWKAAHPVK